MILVLSATKLLLLLINTLLANTTSGGFMGWYYNASKDAKRAGKFT